MNSKYWLIIFCLLSLTFISAYPEDITLKSGDKVNGKIIKQNEKHIYVDLGFTVLQIPLEEVAKVEKPGVETPKETPTEADSEKFQDLVSFVTRKLPAVTKKYTATEIMKDYNNSVVQVFSARAWGTGFVVSPKGHIITNHHVIEGETKIGVTLFQQKGNTFEQKRIEEVTILAFNRYFDVALIQINEKDLEGLNLKPICFGNIDKLKKGDAVFAVGNPGMWTREGKEVLHQTVSEGIISSRSRDMNGIPYLQTTAAINPGNSGGPIFNSSGEVVGLVTYKSFWHEGIGFALPCNFIVEFIKNMEAFVYNKENLNFGYKYCPAPRKKAPDVKKDK
jgi:serine protease Do